MRKIMVFLFYISGSSYRAANLFRHNTLWSYWSDNLELVLHCGSLVIENVKIRMHLWVHITLNIFSILNWEKYTFMPLTCCLHSKVKWGGELIRKLCRGILIQGYGCSGKRSHPKIWSGWNADRLHHILTGIYTCP